MHATFVHCYPKIGMNDRAGRWFRNLEEKSPAMFTHFLSHDQNRENGAILWLKCLFAAFLYLPFLGFEFAPLSFCDLSRFFRGQIISWRLFKKSSLFIQRAKIRKSRLFPLLKCENSQCWCGYFHFPRSHSVQLRKKCSAHLKSALI